MSYSLFLLSEQTFSFLSTFSQRLFKINKKRYSYNLLFFYTPVIFSHCTEPVLKKYRAATPTPRYVPTGANADPKRVSQFGSTSDILSPGVRLMTDALYEVLLVKN